MKKVLGLFKKINWHTLAIGFWGPIVPKDTNSTCGLLQLVQNIINFLTTISVPLATVVIIYGGFRLLVAGGSEPNIKAGKDAILGAVIGLVIVFGAWILINTLLQIVGAKNASSWGSIKC
jgi:type IV secretory pathway VirB2 component (pilin)